MSAESRAKEPSVPHSGAKHNFVIPQLALFVCITVPDSDDPSLGRPIRPMQIRFCRMNLGHDGAVPYSVPEKSVCEALHVQSHVLSAEPSARLLGVPRRWHREGREPVFSMYTTRRRELSLQCTKHSELLHYSLVYLEPRVYPFPSPRATRRVVACDDFDILETILDEHLRADQAGGARADDTY